MDSGNLQRLKPAPRFFTFIFRIASMILIVCFIPSEQACQTDKSYFHKSKVTVNQNLERSKEVNIQLDYGKLPLSFIQNDGQVDPKVKFYEKGNGRATFFMKDGIYFLLTNKQSSSKSDNSKSELIKLIPMGANKHPRIVAEGIQEGKVNYFVGDDPKKWKPNLPTYQAVVYEEIYPGIDLKFYGNNRQMEYDIIVKPGADPSIVKLAYEGIEGLHLTDVGDLEIDMKGGIIHQKKPIIYQVINGNRVDVVGTFKMFPEATNHSKRFTYGFEVTSYIRSQPLLIDPTLSYSTYLGTNYDSGYGIAVDSSGNAYVTGVTAPSSSGFPTTPGAFQTTNGGGSEDAFVTKFNATGSALVYSTYLGGSGSDDGISIAVDSSGNAYVTGITSSLNFPTVNPLQATHGGGPGGSPFDVFVAKLNASGSSLVYSTYLGGNGSEGSTHIALDASGRAYITGYTTSTNFPMANPLQANFGGGTGVGDAFASKLNVTGNALDYSTYLGGTGDDAGNGIAVDAAGNAYVTGFTQSLNFPITPGSFQTSGHGMYFGEAFVTKLNATGSALVYSTYLGGSSGDYGYGITVDASGNAYVTGDTTSSDFPTKNPLQATNHGGIIDAFVTKFNTTGSALVYSTYLGGATLDGGSAIAVDNSGNAYVTGRTDSTDFPLVAPLQTINGGGLDAFVSKFNATGSAFVYSTYLGGSGNDSGRGIALDSAGNAHVTGNATVLFPTTPEAFQPTFGGGLIDAFVTKIGEHNSPTADNMIPMYTISAPEVPQNFTVVYSDPDGFQNITDASIHITDLAGGPHDEWVHYNPATDSFTMMGAVGSCPPAGSGTLSSGFLTLNCATSVASGSGTQLAVAFSLTPEPFFSGPLNSMFITVTDQDGSTQGKIGGYWIVDRPPSVDGLIPVNISTPVGTAQSFTAGFSDPDGYQNISDAGLYLAAGPHNEWVHYSPTVNRFTLIGVNGSCSPGQAIILSNSSLSLNCASSGAFGSGTTLTVIYNLTPLAGSAGTQFLQVPATIDSAGKSNGKILGTWRVLSF